MKTEQEPLDALVFVEKDGADRLKIRSDQLEQIGHKLRGFSVFNSIVLPLIVSAATAFFFALSNISDLRCLLVVAFSAANRFPLRQKMLLLYALRPRQ
jgi:hypothetical protein